jgi:hypothetical protein
MSLKIREAGPQDPIYGIHRKNITDRLTRLNWKTKAVVRTDSVGWLYLWVVQDIYRNPGGRQVTAYSVKVRASNDTACERRYRAEFCYLAEALRYINGEDGGRLAKETALAKPGTGYPAARPAPYYIGFGHPIKIIPRG